MFDVIPTCFKICLMLRNVVRNIFSARRRRASLMYCDGVVPVSCLNRWRKRDGDRFTSTASVGMSHAAAVSAFIFEMITSILRSIVMRPRNEECVRVLVTTCVCLARPRIFAAYASMNGHF